MDGLSGFDLQSLGVDGPEVVQEIWLLFDTGKLHVVGGVLDSFHLNEGCFDMGFWLGEGDLSFKDVSGGFFGEIMVL